MRKSPTNCGFLKCPLCDQLFVDPVVIKACIHRFCTKCLSEHLKKDARCPECSVECPDSSAFCPDEAFALAVKMIKSRSTAEDSPLLAAPSTSAAADSNSVPTTSGHQEANQEHEHEDLNVVLCSHSSVFPLDLPDCTTKTRFIRVPENASLEHLAEFLRLRFEIEDQVDVRREYRIEFTHSTFMELTCSFLALDGMGANGMRELLSSPSTHPFIPLDEPSLLSELVRKRSADPHWPLELTFRLVRKEQ
ncbi:hypothetical protein M3Y99_01923500 [Aphelenchoides fujianensis]|nr:hypothetical protein M3Y99_01923500 [Aphelenchoides fujianensis]